MSNRSANKNSPTVATLDALAPLADYSLMDTLNGDPDGRKTVSTTRRGKSSRATTSPSLPRQSPTPSTSRTAEPFFVNLDSPTAWQRRPTSSGCSPATSRTFRSPCAQSVGRRATRCPSSAPNTPSSARSTPATDTATAAQFPCWRPSSTIDWEMQLKGAGRTPYCRGADGRAVLRSSVREFLAQEHMHALGVPTSRSLSLYVSKTEKVRRPWYSEGSRSPDPDRMISEAVAISTRVAPSFIRVGQLELFARRARKREHPTAMEELEQLVLHLIDREYADVVDTQLPITEKVLLLARAFRSRLTALVANWIRVGYCQGNFNSDNCAAGGFTLDYGPFGFCELFDPQYQPWTGGGERFALLNQPVAAELNYHMFCTALAPLLMSNPSCLDQLQELRRSFSRVMRTEMKQMWAAKLGLGTFHPALFGELQTLMSQTPLDYTIFFRELSNVPDDMDPLKKSFYPHSPCNADPEEMDQRWSAWFAKWTSLVGNASSTDPNTAPNRTREQVSQQMKRVNPKYSLRVVPCGWYQASGCRKLRPTSRTAGSHDAAIRRAVEGRGGEILSAEAV